MTDPFVVPDDGIERVVNVSGGRSSGFLFGRLLEANGGMPSRTRAIFANTGKERPETLDFIDQCGRHFGVEIVWLEYDLRSVRPKHHYKVVTFETASRNGEPFSTMAEANKMLPTIAQRFCTRVLKIETIERYMRRGLGIQEFRNVLGIRYDEPRRWQKALMEECQTEYPLVHAHVTKDDVLSYWSAMPFDLKLLPHESNCDLCFLKGKGILLRILRDRPELADWWIEQESKFAVIRQNDVIKSSTAQFSKRYSVSELLKEAGDTPYLLPPDNASAGIDCFCGD